MSFAFCCLNHFAHFAICIHDVNSCCAAGCFGFAWCYLEVRITWSFPQQPFLIIMFVTTLPLVWHFNFHTAIFTFPFSPLCWIVARCGRGSSWEALFTRFLQYFFASGFSQHWFLNSTSAAVFESAVTFPNPLRSFSFLHVFPAFQDALFVFEDWEALSSCFSASAILSSDSREPSWAFCFIYMFPLCAVFPRTFWLCTSTSRFYITCFTSPFCNVGFPSVFERFILSTAGYGQILCVRAFLSDILFSTAGFSCCCHSELLFCVFFSNIVMSASRAERPDGAFFQEHTLHCVFHIGIPDI